MASRLLVDPARLLRAPTYYRGRVALKAILEGLGVGRGDEVVLQAFTCVAVPEGVIAAGATPRFVDIEPDGFNIDPDRLDDAIGPRTRAIVVQHTFGIQAQLARVLEIAHRRGIPVIEDCCHTYVAADARIGAGSVASFYSFEWGKPLVLGVGGAALVHDPALESRMRGQYAGFTDPPAAKQLQLEAQYLAYRAAYRPALFWLLRGAFRTLSAAGVAEGSFHSLDAAPAKDFGWKMAPVLKRRLERKAGRLTSMAEAARRIAQAYRAISAPGDIVHPTIDPRTDVLVRYPLRVRGKEELLAAARRARVEAADWYATPVHPVPLSQLGKLGIALDEIPNAAQRCAEIVSLPVNARVTRASIDRTAAVLRGFRAS